MLYGWTAGRPIPAAALAALTAIEAPLAVEQAKEVFELFEARAALPTRGLPDVFLCAAERRVHDPV